MKLSEVLPLSADALALGDSNILYSIINDNYMWLFRGRDDECAIKG